jgi:hypothetical protein
LAAGAYIVRGGIEMKSLTLYERFPVVDPAALAAKLAKAEGSLLGLTRLHLVAVETLGPYVTFKFA